jgi:hypothetical protein
MKTQCSCCHKSIPDDTIPIALEDTLSIHIGSHPVIIKKKLLICSQACLERLTTRWIEENQ